MPPVPRSGFLPSLSPVNWLCILICLSLLRPVYGQSSSTAQLGYGLVSSEVAAPHISVSLVSETAPIRPGETVQLALRLKPDKGWHTYWKNPGDTGLPTKLIWDLPQGFRAGEIEWPVPERIDFQGAINFGYHGETWLPVTLLVPPSIDPTMLANGSANIAAKATWLICKDVCIPGSANLSLRLPIIDPADAGAPRTAKLGISIPDTAISDTAISDSAKLENKLSNTAIDWRRQFAQTRRQIPELIHSSGAQFTITDTVTIEVDVDQLPTFTRPLQVLIGSKQVVSNAREPTAAIIGDKLVISAAKDPYLSSAPAVLPVVLVAQNSDGEIQQAVEFVARHTEQLVTTAAELAPSQGEIATVANPGSGVTRLPGILLFALLGGIILNAMPCVFPVLSLKVVSLVESGNHSAAVRRQHGIAYTAGVILSFLLVAAVLIALRLAGEQIGWGFQLQSPWFITFLIFLLFGLGLSLSGLLELGSSLQNLGSGLAVGQADSQHWRGSFLTGVLATVVATPCTAPFMGTAMGFALSQPVLIALLVFAVMGLGLALPFLLIAFIPALANALPKPGNWMVQLKELLAFPIYLTVVWLIWVLSRQAGDDAIVYILTGLVLLALTLWLWRLTLYRDKAMVIKVLAALSLLGALAFAWLAVSSKGNSELLGSQGSLQASVDNNSEGFIQAAYSSARLTDALNKGQPVFVNMTADWCITCKVNERVALATGEVKTVFAERGVVYLKGDWTNADPAISEYLRRFNRDGVPLYVYYAPGQQAVVLPQILTPGIVLNALR